MGFYILKSNMLVALYCMLLFVFGSALRLLGPYMEISNPKWSKEIPCWFEGSVYVSSWHYVEEPMYWHTVVTHV
jgi:hypothetical protein